jgi:hypothetical protein
MRELVFNADDETLGWYVLALVQAVTFDLNAWCRILKLDPNDPGVQFDFEDLCEHWAWMWAEFGDEEFYDKLSPYVTEWEELINKKDKS